MPAPFRTQGRNVSISAKTLGGRLPPFLLSLSSGAALVVALIGKLSLGLTLAVFAVLAAAVGVLLWKVTPPHGRARLRTLGATGLLAGALATIAYDAWRLLLVRFAHLAFNPFDTFVLFGYLIAGHNVSRATATALGTAYHYVNGVAFASAYCFLCRGANWKLGIVWALCLEVLMFSIYPGWLDLKAVRNEFAVVSLSGHLVYGSVLGMVAQRRLREDRRIDGR